MIWARIMCLILGHEPRDSKSPIKGKPETYFPYCYHCGKTLKLCPNCYDKNLDWNPYGGFYCRQCAHEWTGNKRREGK